MAAFGLQIAVGRSDALLAVTALLARHLFLVAALARLELFRVRGVVDRAIGACDLADVTVDAYWLDAFRFLCNLNFILNGIVGERHLRTATEGLAAAGIARLGWLPRRDKFAFHDRHLGLVQARERPDLKEEIAALAAQVATSVDLDRIEALARPPRGTGPVAGQRATGAPEPPGRRIALADDDAFSFIYPHMTAAWRRQGAEIVRFSPLADEAPPDECDSCWLPGGYPELHAGRIAAAGRFLGGLRAFAESRPVHGECGGYMVLGQTLEDSEGAVHAMAGLLGHRTSFRERKLHLGYRRAMVTRDCALGRPGTAVRGHEFHYATIRDEGVDDAFLTVFDGEERPLGACGGRRGHVTGTFFHVIAREI